MNEPWIIAVATNAFVLLGSLWGLSLRATWMAAAMKEEINETINAQSDNTGHEFFKIRQDMAVNDRNFAETVSAVKQRVADVQLEASRTYVDHTGFRDAVKQITETISGLRADLREDFKQMQNKIDGTSRHP